MDPYPVLLSGGDHRGVDSGDQDGGKSLSLPGYSDPARERCRSQADGTPHESGGASGADRASAGRDPRYCTPTLISGFPGETQEDHEELMRFVDEMEFDRLGVFAYSAEEDTPAAGYPDQVPQEVKEDRRDEIMELQQEIAFEKAEDMKGRVLEVMIEGKVADENAFVGRTYKDAPNVDGLIFVNADVPLMSGDFCRVRVTGALEYDLIGELADEFTE